MKMHYKNITIRNKKNIVNITNIENQMIMKKLQSLDRTLRKGKSTNSTHMIGQNVSFSGSQYLLPLLVITFVCQQKRRCLLRVFQAHIKGTCHNT